MSCRRVSRARIARIDRDTTGGKKDYEAILAKFATTNTISWSAHR